MRPRTDTKLKILFMGTGDIAIPSFQALVNSSHDLIGLVTQPDKPVGRKQVLTPPRIKEIALQHDIPVWQPGKARSKKFIDQVEEVRPDIIVVMAYGQLLTSRLIASPRIAIINVHASLLPLYRGASCIQQPIANGDEKTGLTIMHVIKELDAGDIILQRETPIYAEDTGGSVHDRLADMSPDALIEALQLLTQENAPRTPQDSSLSTYAPKLLRTHGLLDFSMSADALERLVRAYHPWPGTYFTYHDKKGKEKRMKVFPPVTIGGESEEGENLRIKCGDDKHLILQRVQPEGSKVMSAGDFLKGEPKGINPLT